MFGPVPRPRWSAVYPPADDNTVPLTAHVILINAARSWGLIDSGFGHHLTDRQKRNYALERNTQIDAQLADLGLSHASIDWVVLSHLHLDHAGGVIGANALPAFPKARIWVQALEAREARDASNRAHGMYTGSSFDQLAALGLVNEVDGEADVIPDTVRVHLTGGHSRGHQATVVSGSEGSALLHLGDLLVTQHHLSPAWVSALDDFPLDTIRAKRMWLQHAAAAGWWVAFSHDVTAVAALLNSEGRPRELR
jgi:glyoxylase-like metal-dependent hydrolase (beta-lactamase superfamily II)